MNNFGKIKSKLLAKLTESYANDNKTEIKEILSKIGKNKDFKEMYLFYEEIENIELSYPDSAQLYIETVEPLLIEKSESIKNICEEITKYVGEIGYEKNDLYECLDVLSEKSNLKNIDKKVVAKKKLIEHLKTKKEVVDIEKKVFTENESLLHAVLTNNFNILYNNTLTEEEKKNLKGILALSYDELEIKTKELKESICSEIENLLKESSDDLKIKLSDVREEVQSKNVSRINYYRLLELKNGLN